MCKITLEYNQNNALARRKLAALLATGLFTKLDEPTTEELEIHRLERDAFLEHSKKTMSSFKPHPAIIVSNDQLQEDEDGMFYLVLISSNDWLNPQYSYYLTDDMIVGHTFDKPSFVKCQIIAGYIERDVIRCMGSIKEPFFNEIVDKIVESIF